METVVGVEGGGGEAGGSRNRAHTERESQRERVYAFFLSTFLIWKKMRPQGLSANFDLGREVLISARNFGRLGQILGF